ncbi:TonB-dependent receptor [Arenibacter certesii]|uniref:TonB-dependent receptor n=4 Tax=Arenibacter certesii TaxID=228955 RepID=UPI00047D8A27|nr:TonB-dependent receptor [Arenibacter certesii]
MRLSLLLLMTVSFVMQANSTYSQQTKISLDMETATIEDVIDDIESKTEFKFIFNTKTVDLNKRVKINVKQASVEEVLKLLFKGMNVSYEVDDRKILLKKRPVSRSDKSDSSSLGAEKMQLQVTGTVSDDQGQPLPGASIVEKGTTNGTQTDFDGNFSLDLTGADATLVVSYIGFSTKEIPVTDGANLNITLEESAAGLDEVVVVGYGTQKKANVSGATSTVDFEEVIADRPISNSVTALQGAIPGLQINVGSGRPGAEGASINIRGYQSLNGGEPLVLMDNVPVNFGDINPEDIASVSVLKDASASAIYGGRAAFGVILITTKKSKKGEKPKITYSSSISISSPLELIEPASPLQFAQTLKDAGVDNYFSGQDTGIWIDLIKQYNQDPSSLPTKDGVFTDENGQFYPLRQNDIVGDFLDETGYTQIHNIGFSGSTEKSSYRVSLGYYDEDGIMASSNDSFNRYNLNAYLQSELSNNLTASLSTNYRASTTLNPVANYADAVQLRTFSGSGEFKLDDGSTVPFGTPSNLARYRTPGKVENRNIRLTGKLEYKPIDNLTITGEYTYQNSVANSRSSNNGVFFYNPFRFEPDPIPPTSYNRSNTDIIFKAFNLYANYERNFDNHNFSLLVGINDESNHNESFSAGIDNLISPDLPTLGLGTENPTNGDNFGEWAVQGAFGRINYNFKEKYFLEASGRYDGSSRFPSADRVGFFPSFSGAWTVSRESFFEPLKDIVSFFKFRGSWGDIGNQNVGLYPYLPTLSSYNAAWVNPNSSIRYTTLSTPGLVSSSFTWERVRTLNYGADINFFSNKLNSSFDIYTRTVFDILAPGADLPGVLGTKAPEQNTATSETKGWEFQMTWRDGIGENFTYNLGFNINDNDAKIIKYDDNKVGLLNNFYQGQVIGELWGYVSDGFYTVDDFVEGTLNSDLRNGTLKDGVVKIEGVSPNPGDAKFADLDGDGIITDGNNTAFYTIDEITGNIIPETGPGDRKVIGNTNRHYRFGIHGGAKFKNFDFSFRINGVGKRDFYNNGQLYFPYVGEFNNVFSHQTNYWTPENTDAYYPRNYPLGGVNYGSSRRTQTKYLQDGAYLSISNISLGYSVSSKVLDRIFLDRLRFTLSAENPFISDNLPPGLNPEFGSAGGNYPFQKKFAFGVNLEF